MTDTNDHALRLAAALFIALYDAHPTYGSTAGWRGGIGGRAITPGCSFIDPPPKHDYLRDDALSAPLRAFLDDNPDIDLPAACRALVDELKGKQA